MSRQIPRVFLAAVPSAMVVAALGSWAFACIVVSRYPADPGQGVASQYGGVFPFGVRAADDFFLPLGNGNSHDLRVIKAVVMANYALTPSNVAIFVYADGVSTTLPARPVPGSLVSGPPNTPPIVLDLGPSTAAGFNLYEVAYALPPGQIRLAPNRWYWLAPTTTAARSGDAAFVAVSTLAPIVGEPSNRSSAAPATPNTYTTWDSTVDCCLSGSLDLAIHIDAVQIGTSPSDVNCSLTVTVQDLFDFLESYFGGLPGGDFNGVGGASVQDIFDFLGVFFGA